MKGTKTLESVSQRHPRDLFDAQTFKCLKDANEQFIKLMARHLLGNMVALFVNNGAVNLDCMQEIGRMNIDEARQFLYDSPQINSGYLPVARCFLKCADEIMAEEIFAQTQKLALNYAEDCICLK